MSTAPATASRAVPKRSASLPASGLMSVVATAITAMVMPVSQALNSSAPISTNGRMKSCTGSAAK